MRVVSYRFSSLSALCVRVRGAATHGAAAPTPPPVLALLGQLPDFTTGMAALETGRFSDALLPLQRATEVAVAYFPEHAAGERALCHSAYGHCFWSLGRFSEAAAQFEAGLMASRGRVPAVVTAQLAEAVACAHFEVGQFDAVTSPAAEAAKAAPHAAFVAEALRVVDGSGVLQCDNDGSNGNTAMEAMRRMNLLITRALPDTGGGDVGEVLDDELAEGRPLAQLLAGGSDEIPSLTTMALRSTAGQLAVASGQAGRPWVRPLFVSALKDYEELRPAGPTLAPLLFRNLGALAELAGLGRDAVTAEGLFRASVGHIEEAMKGPLSVALAGGRGRLWRAQVFSGFATFLEEGREAEKRSTEINALHNRAAAALGVEGPVLPKQLRWGLVHLPSPSVLRAEDFVSE